MAFFSYSFLLFVHMKVYTQQIRSICACNGLSIYMYVHKSMCMCISMSLKTNLICRYAWWCGWNVILFLNEILIEIKNETQSKTEV